MLHLLIALSRGGIDVIYDFVLTVLLANYMYMYVRVQNSFVIPVCKCSVYHYNVF